MRNHTNPKITETLANQDTYVKQLAEMPAAKLYKNQDIVKEQLETAAAQKNTKALELLQVYENQILEARLRQFDAEAIKELKEQAEKNILLMALELKPAQLEKKLRELQNLVQGAHNNRYVELAALLEEERKQVQSTLEFRHWHEEKLPALRKLRKGQKPTGFDRKLVELHQEWFMQKLWILES